MSALIAKAGFVAVSMLMAGGCAEMSRSSNGLENSASTMDAFSIEPLPLENELRLVYPSPERLVAIGDIHGDISAARVALVLAGAINEHDEWVGGKLVVVQVGDQLDRGDDEQEILELFSRLRIDAMQAGGGFHALNGNHELMNCKLDLRYVTPGGFTDFENAVAVDPDDMELNAYPKEHRARVAAFRPGGKYATMLAEQNTIVIVGDTLFVHGGVHLSHVEYGLNRINHEVRGWLLGEGDRPEVISGKESPVWCRHYSMDVVPESRALLEEVLDELGLKRMVVAHTVQDEGIKSHFDDQVWCVDVGMSAHYGGSVQVLEIIGDEVRVLAGD
jgi:Calcineurin-like phosphoesterase